MGNFYDDNEDLRFYMDRGIDWAPLVALTEYEFKSQDGFTTTDEALEFYKELMELIGGFVADEIAPHSEALDNEHPEVIDGEVPLPPTQHGIFEQIKEMELHGMCLPRELGGMNAPLLVSSMTFEMFARADVSVCAHYGFHGGIAMALLVYSMTEGSTEFDLENSCITSTRWGDYIEEIRAGEAFGSMDITEPGCGSDMAAMRTRGEQDKDGNWFVTGQKIFITSGQGKYHLVIARTEETDPDDPMAGLKGLSMFVVPGYTDDEDGNRIRLVKVDGVENKLGHSASATVAVSFENSPAELIGERGDGFKHMLLLMNNARVGVGFESLGLCESARRMALAYAAERPSMGKTIDKHEMIADYLDGMQTDCQAIRAMCMDAGWHEEMAQKLGLLIRFRPPADAVALKKLKKQLKKHEAASRAITPLLKFYAAEKAVDMARLNIQIHGGVGYTKEYGAEKLLRDAMVMPIYEGTTQIQALMAMKDALVGVIKRPKRFVRTMAKARVRSFGGNALSRRVARIRYTACQAIQFLMTRLASSKFKEVRHQPITEWGSSMGDFDPKRDFGMAMLHAERLTHLLTDAAIAEILYKQVQAHPDREDVLVRFLEKAEPRCRYRYDEITTTGLRLLEKLHQDADDAHARAAK